MKNIYEMSIEEKNKHRREFNQLSFTKDINKVRLPLLLLAFFGALVSGILSGMTNDSSFNFTHIIQILDGLVIIAILLFSVSSVYLNICFYRWLKIKHDILY